MRFFKFFISSILLAMAFFLTTLFFVRPSSGARNCSDPHLAVSNCLSITEFPAIGLPIPINDAYQHQYQLNFWAAVQDNSGRIAFDFAVWFVVSAGVVKVVDLLLNRRNRRIEKS